MVTMDELKKVKLNKIKKGEYFKRKRTSQTVFIKNHYDKVSKSFSCSDTLDLNREIFLKASTEVFVGFTY